MKFVLLGLPVATALAFLLITPGPHAGAADHLDPPARVNPSATSNPDIAADIADIFIWHTPDKVNLAMTFGGPSSPSLPAFYDRDLLYKFLVSTQPPNDTPEIVIKFRFGRGIGPNQFGVRLEGVPGVTGGVIEGPVQTVLEKDGVKAIAGLYDDPFFLDSVGLNETRNTGTIRFSNQRDFFGMQNDTAVVLSFPRSTFAGAAMPMSVWSTSARIRSTP